MPKDWLRLLALGLTKNWSRLRLTSTKHGARLLLLGASKDRSSRLLLRLPERWLLRLLGAEWAEARLLRLHLEG